MLRINPCRAAFVFLVLTAIALAPCTRAWARPAINIGVETILASQKDRFVDPKLLPLKNELNSVFRYTSYRLINSRQLQLNIGRKGTVQLPGGRVLTIVPKNIKGKRATLSLMMHKKKRNIFNTEIRLRNHSAIIVGGPKYKNGNLIFRISNSF